MSVYETIKLLRMHKEWTQEEMSTKLNISKNSYGSIERGDTNINFSRLQEIAVIFEIKLSTLIQMSEKKSNDIMVGTHEEKIFLTAEKVKKFEVQIEKMKKEIEITRLIIECLNEENEILKKIMFIKKIKKHQKLKKLKKFESTFDKKI